MDLKRKFLEDKIESKEKRFKDEYDERIFLDINFFKNEDFHHIYNLYKKYESFLDLDEIFINEYNLNNRKLKVDQNFVLSKNGKKIGYIDAEGEFTLVVNSSNYGEIHFKMVENYKNGIIKLSKVEIDSEENKNAIDDFKEYLEDKYEDMEDKYERINKKQNDEYIKFFRGINFNPIFNLDISLESYEVVEFFYLSALSEIIYSKDEGNFLQRNINFDDDDENDYHISNSNPFEVSSKIQSICDDLKTIVEYGEVDFHINLRNLVNKKINTLSKRLLKSFKNFKQKYIDNNDEDDD